MINLLNNVTIIVEFSIIASYNIASSTWGLLPYKFYELNNVIPQE